MPCEDLFDWWTLRCGVWVVFLLALLGNGTVVFVLVFARSKMDVPRFLVCNLAAADFFMGVYLGECHTTEGYKKEQLYDNKLSNLQHKLLRVKRWLNKIKEIADQVDRQFLSSDHPVDRPIKLFESL